MSGGLTLQLDFVYGYHGSRCRDNLFYTKSGDIVYHIAGVGIVYNPKTHTQRFFINHTDDIIALTLHPNGRYVATGQIGKAPYIAIWDSETMETVAILKDFHERGISALGFSNDGKQLVSVGLDDSHTIALWEWEKGRLVTSDKASQDRIFDIQTSPYSNQIVTAGVKHIKFWTYSGNSLIGKRGIFGDKGEIQTILCITFGHNDGITYTSTINGEVYLWKDNKLIRTVQAHKGPVYAVVDTDTGFLTGGKDGVLRVWSKEFEPLQSLNVNLNIRSLRYGNGKILVGTKDSDIYEVTYSGENAKKVHLIEGHGEGELWGLGIHPTKKQFVTASDDKQIKIWDAETKRGIVTIEAKSEARSASFSPDGKNIAVGFLNGSFSVFNAADGKEIINKKERKEEISQIKFAPGGKSLAIGSHDNFVDIYETDKWTRTQVLKGNSSYITHLDWSMDGKFIQTESGSYEHLFFDVATGKVDSKGGAKAEWASFTTVLGKDVEGIWPAYSDKTDVNTLDRVKGGSHVATGDDFGFVKTFAYPAPKGAPCKKYQGHSAHVTNVGWAADGSYLISTGGGDQAVMQWKVIRGGQAAAEPDEADEAAATEQFDSDVEREKEINYERDEKAEAPAEGGLFQIEAPVQAAFAGRPGLGSRPSGGKKPESGQSLSGHAETADAPKGTLDLQYIYGYRGYDTHNNLYYNSEGDVVYNIAAAGIVLNTKSNTQKHFVGQHTDDIISLAVHPQNKLIATGEVGKKPKIIVWDSTTLEKIATLEGGHERGVCALAFSTDGTRLASIGLDDDHSIVVWEWRKGTKIATSKGSKDKIFALEFSPIDASNYGFVTAGVKHISFWKPAGNGIVPKKGIFGSVGELQTMLAIAFDKANTYTGSNDGGIFKWTDNTLAAVIKAHSGPTFALWGGADGFVSGGKDGKLLIWSGDFKTNKSVDLAKIVPGPVVKSVSGNATHILAGTRDGEIIEINKSDLSAKAIVHGHGLGELWGLAVHPSKHQFVSASDDKTINVWDIEKRQLLVKKTVEQQARSAAFSANGDQIAIGFGNGSWGVYHARDLNEIVHKKDRKEIIGDIKFSPDGKYLAVGSHDNFVDIYETDKWTRVGRGEGNSSYITHMDFTAAGDVIVTNSGDYQTLYFQVPSGKRITVSKKAHSELEWATVSGVLGDNLRGIWPKGSDGTDINAADLTKDRSVVATGDDFGFVKIFQYPSSAEFAKNRQYPGHSAHVTNVRWTFDDSHLLSAGGADAAVFQWKYNSKGSASQQEERFEEQYDSDIEREKKVHHVPKVDKLNAVYSAPPQHSQPEDDERDSAAEPSGGLFAMEESTEVVHSGRKYTEDEQYSVDNDSATGLKGLQLTHVHGYRGHDTRNNLFYLNSGEAVYHTAATAVVHDIKKNTQRFFLEHTDDIVSLAYHAGSNIVATGQVGKQPQIIVWDASTLKTISVLRGFHERAVTAISFSKNGKYLVSIGADNNHSIAVYKWKEGTQVATGKGSTELIFDVVFNPVSDIEFITVGDKHVMFWKLAGTGFEGKKGIFGQAGAMQSQTAAAFSADGKFAYTGAVNGEIYEWEGNNLKRVIKGHEGPVFALAASWKGDSFLSGGKDRKLIRWPANFSAPKDTIELPKSVTKGSAIRAISEKDGNVIVGTSGSEIYEIGADNKPKVVVQGHADGELWGLATHPSRQVFATVGDDQTLRIWDVARKAQNSVTALPQKGRSVAFSPDGSFIAVGFENGSFGVYNASTLAEVQKKRPRKEGISDIKFSPDGKYLAVGSHDNFVDIYNTTDYKLEGTAKGNSSYITHVDFTKDSKFLQTNSGAYEHLLYEVPSGKHITDRKLTGKLHDINEWASWTSVLGENVNGIWPKGSDKTDVNSLEVSNNGTFLATGDDFGFVKIFAYPSVKKAAENKQYNGHSAHVTNVRFTFDDSSLLSVGGGDRSIFQWSVV